ncbi:class I SAM-dependent methyltransferase [Mycobacterium sp. HUMS_1102779]|uniref:class I SAM-dependent methyltransferase n=1 Tax=Mycobacterium sp. HUMS_1102779 TaxID=3383487 RepID=UPI00389A1983
MDREQVSLTGTQQTALVTLYGKALDSRRPDSILGDRQADEALRRIDVDAGGLRMRRRDEKSVAVRAKAYDQRVRRFLDDHPDCVVLHLGCGLDARADRVDPPPTVEWYDVDLPDIVALRRRLFGERAHVHTLGVSVADTGLLDTIPGDRPVLVVAEGLTPYLRRADGLAMLRRIVDHFPAGEMLFDAYSRAGVWILQRYPPVKASGAQLNWSIDDPRELERAVPGLVFDGEWWFADPVEFSRYYSPLYWWITRALFRITPVRRLGRGLTYRFGSARGGGV